MPEQKRFVVFERPKGGKSWTIAYKESKEADRVLKDGSTDGFGDFTVPAMFHRLDLAEKWVKDVHSKRLGWWGGKPDQRPMEAYIADVPVPQD